MSNTPTDFTEAKHALKKLPMLGPALWLYARDARKKFTFIADQDWLVMPPLVLDQCKLYMKGEVPWAFCTWAYVSDEVNARLGSHIPKIAPHEWKSGNHLWLIDVVAPFGGLDEIVADLAQSNLAGQAFKALMPKPDGGVEVREYAAAQAATKPGQETQAGEKQELR